VRVVTTCSKAGLEEYGHRWLESRGNWPEGTDFRFYTEGFTVDCPGKDFRDMPDFSAWKLKMAKFRPPAWKWDVVRYAHKVFAACDAFEGYDGVGVWLDADCVTYKPIPAGLIESKVEGVYLARYDRTGLYTETGFWVMNCAHPKHKEFLDRWRDWYYSERFTKLPQWHDCMTLDATIRQMDIETFSLSGDHVKTMHPMSVTELGGYIDHCKGLRKELGYSPENKRHQEARAA
jgi:hypothetical protein